MNKNTAPAVCVIVPAYNAETTLAACCESILSQAVPGGLCCVLADDGSTDATPALCDAVAARDARVTVLHLPGGGVSAARNAGLAHAHARWIVFLDADDQLLPGALAAALAAPAPPPGGVFLWGGAHRPPGAVAAARAAPAANPGAFLLWRYSTDPAVLRAPVADPGGAVCTAPRTALARLYLDCLIGMPWNKLYRADLATELRFPERFSLGEDLQFVLDYLGLLAVLQPGFCFAVVQQPLTYYDCSRAGETLSTRYLPDAAAVWGEHYEKLNRACAAAHCPPADLLPLHRAELGVLGEAIAELLLRGPAPRAQQHEQAAAALCDPRLRELLRTMRAEKNYSPYYLPLRLRLPGLLRRVESARRQNPALYGKLDWAGYYLLGGRWSRG